MRVSVARSERGRKIAPLIKIGGEFAGDKLAEWFRREGDLPGVIIQGEGRGRSYIDTPLHTTGWHVEIRDVSFIGQGASPCGESAQLVLENPGAPTLTRVHFEPAVGTWGLHVAVTKSARPDGTITWQSRGYEKPCARHSMGAYVDVSNHGEGGGILFENQVDAKTEQVWRNEGDKGIWFNHAHIHRGHLRCMARKHDVRRWYLGADSPYIPLPAIEVRDCKIDITDLHADVYPALGVVLKQVHHSEDSPRVRWMGPGGYCEPIIKHKGLGTWYTATNGESRSADGLLLPYFDGNPPPVWINDGGLIQQFNYPDQKRWHIEK